MRVSGSNSLNDPWKYLKPYPRKFRSPHSTGSGEAGQSRDERRQELTERLNTGSNSQGKPTVAELLQVADEVTAFVSHTSNIS